MVKLATSNKSSVSSAKSSKTSAAAASVARARAKAEAAKVRASYASQEAKLKLEKAAREAERITKDAQNQLEVTRIDTELELLTLHQEADTAMVEAQVWEDAAEIHDIMENVKSESEKVRQQRTSKYVQSQINLQNQSPSPISLVPPVEPPVDAGSRDSFETSRPTVHITGT